ncbi:MAG TPA: DUF2834 domain-containing protein [Ramlibacter sp.]|jgi:hypothetical protein
MPKITPWQVRSAIYAILALVGLYLTWTQNFLAFDAGGDYFGDWLNSGPAVLSLVYDIVVAASAATIFMVIESFRLRKPWLMICVPFGLLAIAFSLPLFLALREFELARRG